MVLKAETLPRAPAKRRSLGDLVASEKQRKRVRRLVGYSSLVALLVAGGGVWLLIEPEPVPLAARFRALPVTRGPVVREVRATGRLEAVTTVQVGAEISGRLATVEVEHNDRVKAGQVLARFDRAALSAQLAQIEASLAAARAALAQARAELSRVGLDKVRSERLFASGSVPRAQHDEVLAAFVLAELRVEAADAEVAARLAGQQLARTALDHTVVRSPIDGVVITRNVDPGQTLASTLQAPVLFTVAADLRKMHVIAAVDEADIGEVAVGQPATFTVNAYPGRTFQGSVTEVRNSPQVIQDVVTYGAEIEASNTDLALKPGMTATVRIRSAAVEDALRVPVAALFFTPPGQTASGTAVWVARDGALRRVPVEASISDGELTAVSATGLAPGQNVLIELTPAGRSSYDLAH